MRGGAFCENVQQLNAHWSGMEEHGVKRFMVKNVRAACLTTCQKVDVAWAFSKKKKNCKMAGCDGLCCEHGYVSSGFLD